MKAYFVPFCLVLALALKMLMLPLGIVELGALTSLSFLTSFLYWIDQSDIKNNIQLKVMDLKIEICASIQKQDAILEELKGRVDARSKEIDEVKQLLKMSRVGQIRG